MFYDIWTLFTLSILEIILGIDNLIFISLLVQKTSGSLRDKVRFLGLSLALITRFIALFGISLILAMDKAVFSFLQLNMSIKDCVLIAGGVFLLVKSFLELYNDIFIGNSSKVDSTNIKSKFVLVILQIVLVDLVFSIDSILTAVALTHNIVIISIAFTFAILSMFFLSRYTVSLVTSYPELKVVAILFVFVIGIYLILDGLHIEIPREYIYTAFAFSFFTTFINLVKKKMNFRTN